MKYLAFPVVTLNVNLVFVNKHLFLMSSQDVLLRITWFPVTCCYWEAAALWMRPCSRESLYLRWRCVWLHSSQNQQQNLLSLIGCVVSVGAHRRPGPWQDPGPANRLPSSCHLRRHQSGSAQPASSSQCRTETLVHTAVISPQEHVTCSLAVMPNITIYL